MRMLRSCVLVLAVAVALFVSVPRPASATTICGPTDECTVTCVVVPDQGSPLGIRVYKFTTC